MISGTAYSILLFAIAISAGLLLGRFSLKGITIGSTWILFVGIVMGHFGMVPDAKVLSFMKDLGLILFVYSIGLQVGPGFFSSFKKGGVKLNLLSAAMILMAPAIVLVIHFVTGESIQTLVGVMSGAVTNTPGLGAAQQTLLDVQGDGGAAASSAMASAYAVAYPVGVLGVLGLLILSKAVFKVDINKENMAQESESNNAADSARRMHCEVSNPALFDRPFTDVMTPDLKEEMVVSRMLRDGREFIPDAKTVFRKGDRVLIVTTQKHVDRIRIIFGEEVPMHIQDWTQNEEKILVRKLIVTNSKLTGIKVRETKFRTLHGVTVTRVRRAGVDLVATGELLLQMGDIIQVVGPEKGIDAVAEIVGNKMSALDKPNLVPVFVGIALGVVLGCVPIALPGIPQPVKLGLAGGPLIVAILLGYFGPKLKVTTYTTSSANQMVREIGISFFLAAVGLGAGETFVSSLMAGGWWWILYGAIITIVPVLVIILVSRFVFKLNFFQICGLVAGGTTNPPVLAFAQNAYGSTYTSVNYATVYPLSMFLRVLVAEVMMLVAIV